MRGYVEFESPFTATHKGLPVLLLGVLGDSRFLAVGEGGEMMDLVITEVVIDVRYDYAKREWVDVTRPGAD